MIKFVHDNREYSLEFDYVEDATTAILGPTLGSNLGPISVQVVRYFRDPFDREKGRRFAIRKLISSPGYVPKELRAAIWQAYFASKECRKHPPYSAADKLRELARLTEKGKSHA